MKLDVMLDPAQQNALKILQQYQPLIDSNNILSTLFRGKRNKCGVYLWGEVGRGKSIVMQSFFKSLETSKKLSTFFHQFMLDLHKAMHEMRSNNKAKFSKRDFLLTYAEEISDKYRVICLDELQVTNIADAMLVGRFFKALMKNGTMVFFTSNRVPMDLFKDGLQREQFIPFIDLVNDKLDVIHLDNNIDYRLETAKQGAQYYYYPLTSSNIEAVDEFVQNITGKAKLHEHNLVIDRSRIITVSKAWGTFADFTFAELCNGNLGSGDYIKIAKTFHTIVIRNILPMSEYQHNEALRFITLVDCLYEHKIKVIFLSDSAIDDLYIKGKHKFEFSRCTSRIHEMTSPEYWDSEHDALPVVYD